MSQASNSLLPQRRYLVALGSNLFSEVGSSAETLQHAVANTERYNCKLINISRFFSSPAFPAGNGPDYVNAAFEVAGPADPEEMLAILHKIESVYGRTRDVRWGQRTLDMDLIAAEERVIPDLETHARWRGLSLEQQMSETPDELLLPHPRLQDRAFVLVPLVDIAPDWRHPILGLSVLEMRDALPPAVLEELVPLD